MEWKPAKNQLLLKLSHLSHSSFLASCKTRRRSNLLNNGLATAMFTLRHSEGSYGPLGFVAAKIVVLVLSLQTIPALATLIVCCSIASWIPENQTNLLPWTTLTVLASWEQLLLEEKRSNKYICIEREAEIGKGRKEGIENWNDGWVKYTTKQMFACI